MTCPEARGGWLPFGDAALLAARPAGIKARALVSALRACPGVTDAVVTEDRVCVHFEPREPPRGLENAFARATAEPHADDATEHLLRARYDGPDLAEIAAHAALSTDEVARLHAARTYEVLLVGFLPGFAYLGGLDPRLDVPRRPSPRPRVDARSIGIAAGYTAVYPFASPGGWSLIGQVVDGELFSATNGARLRLGDRVRFERVG
jgi:UPF0271 protein